MSNSHRAVLTLAGAPVAYAAFRDGLGPWRVARAGGDGNITAQVTDPEGRFSFLVVRQFNPFEVDLWQSTLAEWPNPKAWWGDGSVKSFVLSGDISNIPTDGTVLLCTPYLSVSMNNGPYKFDLGLAPSWDLVSEKYSASGSASILVRRNLAAASQTQNFDFDSKEYEPSESYYATAVGPNGAKASATSEAYTANGTWFSEGSAEYTALPPDLRRPGDYYVAIGGYEPINNPNWVVKSIYSGTPGNFSLTLPNVLSSPLAGIVPSGSTHVFEATWSPDPSAQLEEFAVGSPNNQVAGSAWYVLVTAGWLGTGVTKTYVSPNLDSLPGWNPQWDIPSSVNGISLSSLASPQGIPGILRDNVLGYSNRAYGMPQDGDSVTSWNFQPIVAPTKRRRLLNRAAP